MFYHWPWCAHLLSALGRQIHDATRINDLATIKRLVEKDRASRRANDDREMPLHIAAQYGDAETVRYLISMGARRCECQCYNEFTPLHLTNDPQIAQVLIEKGTDLKVKSAFPKRRSSTRLLTRISRLSICFLPLVKNSTSITRQTRKDQRSRGDSRKTPWMAKAPHKLLHTACGKGILRSLVCYFKRRRSESGFRLFKCGRYLFATIKCCDGGHSKWPNYFVTMASEMDVAGGKLHNSLFHYAVSDRNLRFVKLMLEHGADVAAP